MNYDENISQMIKKSFLMMFIGNSYIKIGNFVTSEQGQAAWKKSGNIVHHKWLPQSS
jgi:hypothetical protein